jgi:hypothetical protein
MPQIAVGPQVSQIWAGTGPVLVANQDITNSITVARTSNVSMGAANADIIPPLGSVTYGGTQALYAIAPAGTTAVLIIPDGSGWAPSPAQVANQIAILGVPPSVQNVKGYSALQVGPSGSGVFETFSAPGRLWAAHLSFALTAGSTHAGSDQAFCSLQLVPGSTLLVVELAISGANQAVNGDADLTIPGLAFNNGDQLNLNVNGGSSISNATMRASCVVLASMP